MGEQEQLFEDPLAPESSKVEEQTRSAQKVIAEIDRFLARSWRAADLLLASEEGDALFAAQRAYFAVYAVCVGSAVLLQLDISKFQRNSEHHKREHAIPHSHMPALASHLRNMADPPLKLGTKSADADATFSLVRQLQKMRKRADYMGTETLTRDAGRALVAQAKELCQELWRYTREHVG